MSQTLTALRTLFLRHAPEPHARFHVEKHCVHAAPDCARIHGQPATLDPAGLVDLALVTPLGACLDCTDEPSPWHDIVCSTGVGLPRIAYTGPDRPLHLRSHITPDWLDVDPLDARAVTDGCCRTYPEGESALAAHAAQLASRHIHEHLSALASAHGAPTTWVALGYSQHLAPRLSAATALDALADFHPWAVVADDDNDVGIVILHLPDSLARTALTLGGVGLDAEHVTTGAWPVTRRVLMDALQDPGHDVDTLETSVLARCPELFAVAHAATH